jgi:hypothetical protein
LVMEFCLTHVQGFGMRLKLGLLLRDFIRSHGGGARVVLGFWSVRVYGATLQMIWER